MSAPKNKESEFASTPDQARRAKHRPVTTGPSTSPPRTRPRAPALLGAKVCVELPVALRSEVMHWVSQAGGSLVTPADEHGVSVLVTHQRPRGLACAILLIAPMDDAETMDGDLPPRCIVLHPPLSRVSVVSSLRQLAVEWSAEQLVARAAERWSLTPRQVELLEFNLYGYSDKEIAAALGLSRNTVETYQKQLRRRTGAHSRQDYLRLIADVPRVTTADTRDTVDA